MIIKGTAKVNLFDYRGTVGSESYDVVHVGEIDMPMRVTINPDYLLVWAYNAKTGTKTTTRRTHKFYYNEITTGQYTAVDGTICKHITFYGKLAYKGNKQELERFEISSFDDFETCHMYLTYEHTYWQYRGAKKELRGVDGDYNFYGGTNDTTILQKMWQETGLK